MKTVDFARLMVLKEDTEIFKLKEGDIFLLGPKMIEQTSTKRVGEIISYWKVESRKGNNISYFPVYEKLEE